ncbi:hypothetical protein R0J89_18760, partial [Psychrobacter sp. SIMBA_152]
RLADDDGLEIAIAGKPGSYRGAGLATDFRIPIMHRLKHGLLQAAGWLFYLSLLMGIAMALPASTFDSESKDFIFLIGFIGIWRYSM